MANQKSEILNMVIKEISQRVGCSVLVDQSLKSIKGWDSLTQAKVLLALEQKYKINFLYTDVVEFEKVSDLVISISKKTQL